MDLTVINQFLEQLIEFFASAVCVWLYTKVMRRRNLETGPLAIFSLKMYAITNLAALAIGLALSPCMLFGGGVSSDGYSIEECENATCACSSSVGCDLEPGDEARWYLPGRDDEGCCVVASRGAWGGGPGAIDTQTGDVVSFCLGDDAPSGCSMSPSTICVVLLCYRLVFYAFVNELGDSTKDIGKTQWLAIFQGTELRFPGCTGRRRCFHRRCTAKSLSTFLMIFQVVLTASMAVIYSQVKKTPALSWMVVLIPGTMGAIVGIHLVTTRRELILGGFADLKSRAGAALTVGGDRSPHAPPRSAPVGTETAVLGASTTSAARVSQAPSTSCELMSISPSRGVSSEMTISVSSVEASSEVGASVGSSRGGAVAGATTGSENGGGGGAGGGGGGGGDADAPLLRPWQLRVDERLMVVLLIIAKTAPDQMNSSVLALMQNDNFETDVGDSLGAPTVVIRSLVFLMAAAGGLYLFYMLRTLPADGSAEDDDAADAAADAAAAAPAAPPAAGGNGGTLTVSKVEVDDAAAVPSGVSCTAWYAARRRRQGPMVAWSLMLWTTLVVYTLTGLFLYLAPGGVGTGVFTLCAMLCYLFAQPPYRHLRVSLETFPLLYDATRSGSLIYWQNVGAILLSGCLAGVKVGLAKAIDTGSGDGGSISCDEGNSMDQERTELGLGVFVTAAVFLATAVYFTAVDPRRPRDASVTLLVRSTFARRESRAGDAATPPRHV